MIFGDVDWGGDTGCIEGCMFLVSSKVRRRKVALSLHGPYKDDGKLSDLHM